MITMYRNTLQIPYMSQHFPNGTVLWPGNLQINWNDRLWPALTVGRPNTAYVFRHGQASYYEALFRLSLVCMALEQCTNGRSLCRTKAFKSSDPTEKGAVSYFLGMVVCKLFANRLPDTPWVLHLVLLRDKLSATEHSGRARSGLVGEDDNGAWHAFECKGSSSVPNTVDRRKAKAQAQRLVRVGSTDCSLHISAIAYFRQEELEFDWRDPDPEEVEKLEPLEVRLAEDDWRHYYEPALALATIVDTFSPIEGRTAPADVNCEMDEGILELLLEAAWAKAQSLGRELKTRLVKVGFQADGVKVGAVSRGEGLESHVVLFGEHYLIGATERTVYRPPAQTLLCPSRRRKGTRDQSRTTGAQRDAVGSRRPNHIA